jgi:hypothetical protein
VEREVRAFLDAKPDGEVVVQKRLDEERRKLANLIAAIEASAHAPASTLKAVCDREAAIQRLEEDHRRAQMAPEPANLDDLPAGSIRSCRTSPAYCAMIR